MSKRKGNYKGSQKRIYQAGDIYAGFQFVREVEGYSERYAFFICNKCGQEFGSVMSKIKNGKRKDCGCSRMYTQGDTIGICTFLEKIPHPKHSIAKVKCPCGQEFQYRISRLESGASCGCRGKLAIRHNGFGPKIKRPEYYIYHGMRTRCLKADFKSYPDYGGRGIKICERWLQSFDNFFADMGPRPSPGHTLERNNNDGPYGPDNCRWATRKEQNRNKRTTRMISYQGKKKSLIQWSELYGCNYKQLHARLKKGWPLNLALSQKNRPGTLSQIENEVKQISYSFGHIN